MIINMKQYLLTITILWLTTCVSGRGPIPLRYSVSTTTSVGGPLPPTSPSPCPAPAPAPGPAPATSPAPSLATPSSPRQRSNPNPAKSSPPPPSTTKSSPTPSSRATSSPPPPSPTTSSRPPLSRAASSPPPPTQARSSPPQNPPPAKSSPLTPPQPKQQRIPKVGPVNPSLKYFCKSTDYPDLCVSSLSPFVVAGHTDPVGILEAGIKAASGHVELTIPALARLKSSPSWSDQAAAAALDNCKDNYSDALDNLKSAATAVTGPTHDVWTANSMLSAVVSDSETCEDGFQGVGESPITAYNDKLRMMASNCLAIASLVK